MACLLGLPACSSSSKPIICKDTPEPACMVSTGLPNNSIGQLGIQIIQVGRHVRIIIPSDAVFDGRTAEIKSSAHNGLNALANFLAKYPNHKIIVTGYTDNLGTYQADAALCEHQAQNLITYFWTRGVPHQCLTAVGMGKNSLTTISSNRSINGKTANRRVEITFTTY